MGTSRFYFLWSGLTLGLAATLLMAPGAGAQEPDRQNCVCFDGAPGSHFGTLALARGSNRARIGVILGREVDVDGRTGVRVEQVVADGPADQAGLREGDVIADVNGTALGDDPARALVEALRDVDPGDTVTLTYYRDGSRRTAELVTDEATGMTLFRGGDGFDVRVAPFMDPNRIRDRIGDFDRITTRSFLRRLSPAGLELAELNPALGEYFGTDRGVLVIEIDDDSALNLRAGDVILAIDGRDVRDPAHVRSIIGSYRADEEITFEIVRRERRTEVTGRLDR